MKKVIVMTVFLISALSVFGQEYGRFGFGINGSYYQWKGYAADFTLEDQHTSYTLGLSFSVMLGQSFELRPYVTYGSMKSEAFEVQDDGSISIGGGVGVYWHILHLDHLRMGPGASFDLTGNFDTYPSSDTANTIIPNFRIPMMLEFVMTKNFVFRLEYTMFGFYAVLRTANNDDWDNYAYVTLFPTDPTKFQDATTVFLGSQILILGVTLRF